MSLPLSSPSFTSTNPQGDTSFYLGRNISDSPFREFSYDGISKREFMPHRSSTPHEIVSNEIKPLNYNNYQQQLTFQNIDDITLDIMLLKQKDQIDKEHIALLEAKIDHLLSDQEEVKNAIILQHKQ